MTALKSVKSLISENSANINLVTDEFIAAVKEYIARTKNEFNDDEKKTLIKELDQLYKSYFSYVGKWAQNERRAHANEKNHADAIRLKKDASKSVKEVEANIEKFAICYLEINATMGKLYDHLKNVPEHKDDSKMKWTSDMGVVLKRYIEEIQDLKNNLSKLTKARTVLVKAEELYKEMESAAKKTFGDKFEANLMPIRSALRAQNFAAAKKAVDELPGKVGMLKKKQAAELQKHTTKFIEALKPHSDDLAGEENKMYYRLNEVSVALDTTLQDLVKKASYIDKYHRPYVKNKLKSLESSREKLSVIGSIDNLNMLYLQLMKGVAKPLTDIKDVKEYETNVIQRINYLLEWQYKDIETQSQRTKELLQECYKYFENFAFADAILKQHQN